MTNVLQDLKYALRMLAKNPGFTAVAVLSLALGIGITSTVFSIVDGMFLRPWPVKNPSQLVMLFSNTDKDRGFGHSSYPDYLDVRNQNSVFSGVLAYGQRGAFVGNKALGKIVPTDVVSENYFSLLGINAVAGRTFVPGTGQEAMEEQSVVLSFALWQRLFGGDPSLVGKTILVDGKNFTVLGITPQGFHGLGKEATDMWVTPKGWIAMIGVPAVAREFESRDARWLYQVARLRPGVRPAQVTAQLHILASRLAQAYPATNKSGRFDFMTAAEWLRIGITPALFLTAMVGLVLLISSANVANLLLAQAEKRQRETALRAALGASQRRLIDQLLTESMVVALIGGSLGLLLASGLVKLVPALVPLSPFQLSSDIQLDGRILAFTAILSILTAVVFGLIPALRATKADLVTFLKGGETRIEGESHGVLLRNSLVVSEIALCLILLTSSGLLLRSLLYSQRIHTGFDANKNLLMICMIPPQLYGYDREMTTILQNSLLERLKSLPGVARASYARRPPLAGFEDGETQSVVIPGYQPASGEEPLSIRYNIIAPGYLRTIGTTILRGRDFGAQDSPTGPKAVIINETMAKRIWPHADPLGKNLTISGVNHQIVGVVEGGAYVSMHEPPQPYLFFPFSQMDSGEIWFFVETVGGPKNMIEGILQVARTLDKNLLFTDAKTMKQHMQLALATERAATKLLVAMSLLGMFLAAVGLYGVISYFVNCHTREIGLRMALGAGRPNVLGLVLRQALRLGMIGVVIGLGTALAVTQLMSSRLYGVKPGDPLTYLGSSCLVLAVTLIASYIPARRATKVDPMVALRYE